MLPIQKSIQSILFILSKKQKHQSVQPHPIPIDVSLTSGHYPGIPDKNRLSAHE